MIFLQSSPAQADSSECCLRFDSLLEMKIMFRWAIIFAVIALLASILGFGGVAGLSADFAWIFLIVAVILAIVALVTRSKVSV